MRSRAPLALMEQVVMVLVFALAAALCLQAFALSDRLSRRSEERDRALLVCQQAAEELKAAGGEMIPADGAFFLHYDEDWNELGGPAADAAYVLTARRQSAAVAGLGLAEVSVARGADGETLFSLPVAWQEVDAHG